jgi:hypothetical protein
MASPTIGAQAAIRWKSLIIEQRSDKGRFLELWTPAGDYKSGHGIFLSGGMFITELTYTPNLHCSSLNWQ